MRFPRYCGFVHPTPELRPDRLYVYLDALYRRREVPGAVVEVGCFRGGTTRLAYRFLQQVQPSRRYVAVDTFAGFADPQFEHDRRRGTPGRLRTGFGMNDIGGAVRRFLDADGCAGVELVRGDITTLRDSALPDTIAVCLLDVDLELPTYGGLSRAVARLAPGGVALVDDCDPGNDYPGALAGYRRFARERNRREEFFMGMGIVRRDAA
jgi:O-methyltransferase